MKILIVSYYFPPFNQVGSVRVGKFAKYLSRNGHDVRVLACQNVPLPSSLKVEIDECNVIRSGWIDVNWPIRMLLGRSRIESKGYEVEESKSRWVLGCKKLYQSLVHFPDAQVGWLFRGIRSGKKLCKHWKPDIIYASAPPVTSLFIASSLARHYEVPWFAEFRDLWVDNHYREVPKWRHVVESILERRLLSSVSGLVTVSDPLAESLQSKYPGIPVLVLPNGFDAEDYHRPVDAISYFDDKFLNLVYTGMLYSGRYDLDKFFMALSQVGERSRIAVHFFGRYIRLAEREANQAGVSENVHCHDPVPYQQSIVLQRQADILLMFLWNDPSQKGVYTGKLFEYLAARRPILAIGPKANAPARLITDRGAGLVSEDPEEIASWLANHWRTKLNKGSIPGLNRDVCRGFERQEQVRKLEEFICSCLSK